MDRYFKALDRKIKTGQTLTLDEVRYLAPSAFAEEASPDRSHRYRYIPTSEPINALVKAGFEIVGAGESATRIPGNENYVRHMVKMRHPSMKRRFDGVFPQVNILNSHNGTSAWHLYAGVWRQVCSNGMVAITAEFASIRVLHSGSGDIVAEVLRAVEETANRFPVVFDQIDGWMHAQWSETTMLAFAEEALKLRWDNPPISPADALAPNRMQDRGNSPWLVMNRIQENLTKGGTRYYRNGRRNTTRAITSINADLTFNKKLWNMTDAWVRGDYRRSEDVIDAEYEVVG